MRPARTRCLLIRGVVPLLLILPLAAAAPAQQAEEPSDPSEATEQASDAAADAAEETPEAAAPEAEEAYLPDPKVATPPPWTEDEDWQPPELSSEFDWIQLDTGEWLKGDFEELRDRKVTFDSDEMDTVEFDFSDIVRFYLPRPHSYRLESTAVHRGASEMRNGVVRVRTPTGIVEFHRDEIVRVVQGIGRERDRWSTDLGLGIALRRGNTRQTDFTGSAKIRRESALTRLNLDYNGVISEVNNSETANSHRASAAFDVYLTKRLFVTVPFFEFYTDEFQNIDQRYTPAAAVGYELIRRSWLEWEASVGAGYQYTKFTSSTTGDASDFATLLSTEINFDWDALDWDNLYRIQITPTNMDNTNQHLESVLSFDIWGPLDLDISFIWDFVNNPPPDANGVSPKSTDVRLTFGFGLDF